MFQCLWRFDLTCVLHTVSAASLSTIVCDVADKVNLVLECVRNKEHSVKTIVLMGAPSTDLVSKGQQAGIHIVSLQDMEVSRRLLPFTSSSAFLCVFILLFSGVLCLCRLWGSSTIASLW